MTGTEVASKERQMTAHATGKIEIERTEIEQLETGQIGIGQSEIGWTETEDPLGTHRLHGECVMRATVATMIGVVLTVGLEMADGEVLHLDLATLAG